MELLYLNGLECACLLWTLLCTPVVIFMYICTLIIVYHLVSKHKSIDDFNCNFGQH